MNARPLCLTALLLLLAAPVASAGPAADVRAVYQDVFEPIAPDALSFAPCDGGAFTVLPNGFDFHEVPQGGGPSVLGPVGQPDGYLSSGCGTATYAANGTPSYDHLHIRFEADRRIQEYQAGGVEVNPNGTDFSQDVLLLDRAGGPLATVPFFPHNDTAQPVRPFDLRRTDVRSGGLSIQWHFSDNNLGFLAPGQPNPFSGEDYRSTVTNLSLEFSGQPTAYDLTDHQSHEGTLLLHDTSVRVALGQVGSADLRVEVGRGLAFEKVLLPNGTALDLPTTRHGNGPGDWDRSRVLIENFGDAYSWITVPKEVLAKAGPGDYTVQFRSVATLRTQPLFLPLVLLVLLVPLPFAVVAYRKVRRFEREAFGAYRRSARNLRIALIVAVVYYATVVANSILGTGLDVLVAWPLPLAAAITYLQVAIAIAAFVALYFVARELYSITAPKETPAP